MDRLISRSAERLNFHISHSSERTRTRELSGVIGEQRSPEEGSFGCEENLVLASCGCSDSAHLTRQRTPLGQGLRAFRGNLTLSLSLSREFTQLSRARARALEAKVLILRK